MKKVEVELRPYLSCCERQVDGKPWGNCLLCQPGKTGERESEKEPTYLHIQVSVALQFFGAPDTPVGFPPVVEEALMLADVTDALLSLGTFAEKGKRGVFGV